jgi:lysozyme
VIAGVDVWSGYGQVDWNLVRASGVRFAWLKCQEGNEGKDPLYERNVQRARDAGITVGAYHFAFPLPLAEGKRNRAPVDQAELYFAACSGLGSAPGELTPALDLEWPPPNEWAKWGCSAQQVSDWGQACVEAMTLLWGRTPVLYTYPWFWKALALADVSWAAKCPLWMASYAHSWDGLPSGVPPVPAPWADWAAWQYSAEGSSVRVPGIPACPVDRDCIKDEATFDRLTGRGVDQDAPTVPRLPDFDVVHSLNLPGLPGFEPPDDAA